MTPIPIPRALARPGCIAALLLLGACAGQVQPPPTAGTWSEQRAALEQLDAWTATGKVAVRSASASESGSMVWRQQRNRTELRLSGPVGVGTTTVVSDGDTLQIDQDGERRVLDIATPGALARETGWDLPLAALPYWLRALPAPKPAAHSLEMDASSGQPQVLEQDGWQVRYGDFRVVQHLLLPSRLDIERGDTRARVFIRQWTLDTASPGHSDGGAATR